MSHIAKEMRAYREALVARGLSVTRQRLKLGELIFSTHGHFTPDEFDAKARKAGLKVGRVTVYRTLNLMVDAGLVEERVFERGRIRYEHTIGHAHHDHMVCVSCGKVIEFESEAIERAQQAAAARQGFSVLHHSHTLFGHCKKCARAPRPAQAAAYGRPRGGARPPKA